ncbi:MAG: histidine kinase dimerization/phosphoacceptor domain -containing protein [Methylovirgula sp.]
MMTEPLNFKHIFDALSHPAFVVSMGGRVEHANRAATLLLGRDLTGEAVTVLDREKSRALPIFLRRSSGSRQPIVGKLHVCGADSKIYPLRCRGRLLRPADSAASNATIFIECEEGNGRFSIFAGRLRNLNDEMRQRRHVQALLEESLRQRDVLMRELQHRVRNNLQMVSGMLSAAGREAKSGETRVALTDAASRVTAVGAVQQVLYDIEHAEAVAGAEVVRELCAFFETGAPDCRLNLRLGDVALPNEIAAPMALILNELLTNAVKYGKNGEAKQQVEVELHKQDGEIVLSIRDNGPGFKPPEGNKRASGLGLVRGLLRQIGGKLEVQNQNGARCVVRVQVRA